MPEHDSRALPLSTASGEAAAAYREGVDRLLSARPGAGERLDAAIAADPDFALAHAARARAHAAMAEGAAARDRIARAAALVARRGTERERAHVALLTHAIAGRGAEAVDAGLAHAEAWPRDALALSLLLGAFGLLAFSGRADHDAARLALCEALAPRIGEDWWFTGHHGWSLAEAGRPAEGMPLAERALALRPDNGNAAHALAHALFELDRSASAGDFLAGWLPGYDPAAPLHGHLSWHRALALLEAGDAPGALGAL
jgi:tetratricopeptide (TPR) repeat protein